VGVATLGATITGADPLGVALALAAPCGVVGSLVATR
jgi:hypothetical protein